MKADFCVGSELYNFRNLYCIIIIKSHKNVCGINIVKAVGVPATSMYLCIV